MTIIQVSAVEQAAQWFAQFSRANAPVWRCVWAWADQYGRAHVATFLVPPV